MQDQNINEFKTVGCTLVFRRVDLYKPEKTTGLGHLQQALKPNGLRIISEKTVDVFAVGRTQGGKSETLVRPVMLYGTECRPGT